MLSFVFKSTCLALSLISSICADVNMDIVTEYACSGGDVFVRVYESYRVRVIILCSVIAVELPQRHSSTLIIQKTGAVVKRFLLADFRVFLIFLRFAQRKNTAFV